MSLKPTPQKLDRRTTADAVADEIRRRIVSGELKDGEPLRQDVLANALGVSRIPVREALGRLQSEGLVASFPHRGAVVTALSRDDIAELFDLRALLEPELIRVAVPRLTPADLNAARAILEDYDRGLDTVDVHAWGEFNTRFHMSLYAAASRRKTLEMVRSLLVNTDRYIRLVLVLTGDVAKAKEDHGGLLELCAAGHADAAADLTRGHVLNAKHDLIAYLDRQETPA
jgi:DNA-binding GntR family transcriptional regulator